MPHPVSTAERLDAWTALAEASRGAAAERKVLRDLLQILAAELGASRVRLVLEDGSATPGFMVSLGGSEPAAEGAELSVLTMPVPGGSVVFEGAQGSLAGLDGPAYVARGAVHTAAAIAWTKRILREAFQAQLAGRGFSFVEILTSRRLSESSKVE